MRFVVFALVLLARPTPADACSKRHQSPFELFDRAETVALVRWAQATDAAARAAIVVDAIAGSHVKVRAEAIEFLLDEPKLLDAVTAEQTQRIAKVAKTMAKDWAVTLLLARLRDPSAPSRANVAGWARATRAFLATKQTETDPQKLSAVIEKPTRDADPRRVAALERCERVHGVSLFAFINYVDGTGSQAQWKALADACRTGKPARD